jgi:tetratricopeptide (TPR) repeat protein
MIVVSRYLFVAMVLVGIAVQRVGAESTTKTRLDACITYYQDGEYQKAVDSIKSLLPLISDRREEAEAYKYLGFSYVMLDFIDKAKDFFRVALEKFPQMVIDTLEVPPNITIVFKQAKLETQIEKGEMLDKKVQDRNQKRVVFGSMMTALGAIGAGAGGFLIYLGFDSWQKYNSITTPYPGYQDDLDKYSREGNRNYLVGGCGTGIAAATLYFGIRLLRKKNSAPKAPQKVGLFIDDNAIAITYHF